METYNFPPFPTKGERRLFMPSNYTPNYQLNQWSPDDRVLRTDFNADNAKIDAALGRKLGQIEVLRDYYVEGSFEMRKFSVVQNSANDWSMTGFVFTVGKLEGSANPRVSLYIDDKENREIAITTSFPVMCVFFPFHDENRLIQGIFFGSSTVPFVLDVPFKDHLHGSISGVDGVRIFDSHLSHFGIR